MARTGVEVTTALSAGRRNNGVPSARYHLVGVTERGPVGVAQRVTSIAEYESYFGVRTPKSEKTYNDARLFFAEGGAELFVTRVVGPGATKGFVNLMDSTGVNTVRVELNEPGAFSARTTVDIDAGANDTFTFTIAQDGVMKIRLTSVGSPSDLGARLLGNPLVSVSDLGSPAAAPGNNPVPTTTPVPLSEGVDDFVNVAVDEYVAALAATGDDTRGGAVAVPDLPADIIGPDLIEHAKEYQKVALLCGDVHSTQAEIAGMAQPLAALEGADHAGVFWPYLVMKDEDNGGARYVAPTGYVAAVRARAHTTVGYWQIPAGERSAARSVVGLHTPVDTRKNDALADSYVSGIIQDGGVIKLYNWWSLSQDRANFGYLSVRDELNNIAMDLASEFKQFIFATWDSRGKLLNQISSAAKGILATLAERDAVAARFSEADGSQLDPGYTINVDAPSGGLVEQNTILVRVEVRTPQTAQLIRVEVVRVPLDGAL